MPVSLHARPAYPIPTPPPHHADPKTPRPDAGHGTVKALLGPANTRKTHLAIERILQQTSGMIAFLRRLLARENDDAMIQMKRRGQVALLTGEEKVLPTSTGYFLCTIHSTGG